jgi:hypothetical protein
VFDFNGTNPPRILVVYLPLNLASADTSTELSFLSFFPLGGLIFQVLLFELYNPDDQRDVGTL